MPSGAKKRKAAKKKKGLQIKGPPHLPLPHSIGEEDLEHQNDKDSDGGDVSSPASQDNHNCHELMDQEEEEVDKQSSICEQKSDEMTNRGEEMKKGTMEEESALQVVEVDKQENYSLDPSSICEQKSDEMTNRGEEMKKGTMEEESALQVEEVDKQENYSLDPSSICEQKSVEMTNGGEKMEKGTMEEKSAFQVEEVDKQEDGSLDPSSIREHKSDEMTNGDEETEKGAMEEEESALHLESEIKVEDELPSKDICIEAPNESHEGSNSEDGSTTANKNKIVVDETPAFDLVEEVDTLSAGKVNGVETVFTTDLDKAAISENEVEKCVFDGSGLVKDGEGKMGVEKMELGKMEDEAVEKSHENDAEASDATDFATQVNGEKVTTLHDVPKVCASIGDEGVGKRAAGEAIQILNDSDVKTSESKDYATMEKSDTLTLSYNAPQYDASIGADHVKDSELSEHSYNQHQVGSALQPVQTTSWKGCCGLFELFTGSNR